MRGSTEAMEVVEVRPTPWVLSLLDSGIMVYTVYIKLNRASELCGGKEKYVTRRHRKDQSSKFIGNIKREKNNNSFLVEKVKSSYMYGYSLIVVSTARQAQAFRSRRGWSVGTWQLSSNPATPRIVPEDIATPPASTAAGVAHVLNTAGVDLNAA